MSNPWQITIADNASTDSTGAVSRDLCQRFANVSYLHLTQKGRGRALRTAWLQSSADIVSYMDVDLSTDIVHFPAMVAALESGYQVAVGSRHSRGSQVNRGFKRDFISRSYNLLVKVTFLTSFPDAQ